MKRYLKVLFFIITLIYISFFVCCSFQDDDESIENIIDDINYVIIHKQTNNYYYIFIDNNGDKAYGWRENSEEFSKEIVYSSVYREKYNVIYFTEDGAYTKNEKENTYYKELSKETYFSAIKKLDLKVKDIKENNYTYIAKNERDINILLKQEILSDINSDGNKLKHIQISFDKKFRPIKIEIKLESSKYASTKEELNEREKGYTHWFSYDLNKQRFNKEFKEIKETIYEEDKEYQ